MPIELIDGVPVDTDTGDIIREYQMEIDFTPIDECTKQVKKVFEEPPINTTKGTTGGVKTSTAGPDDNQDMLYANRWRDDNGEVQEEPYWNR